jgi:hypothetical protein
MIWHKIESSHPSPIRSLVLRRAAPGNCSAYRLVFGAIGGGIDSARWNDPYGLSPTLPEPNDPEELRDFTSEVRNDPITNSGVLPTQTVQAIWEGIQLINSAIVMPSNTIMPHTEILSARECRSIHRKQRGTAAMELAWLT